MAGFRLDTEIEDVAREALADALYDAAELAEGPLRDALLRIAIDAESAAPLRGDARGAERRGEGDEGEGQEDQQREGTSHGAKVRAGDPRGMCP